MKINVLDKVQENLGLGSKWIQSVIGGQAEVSPVRGGVESLALHLSRAAELSGQAEKCSECSQILRKVPRHQA